MNVFDNIGSPEWFRYSEFHIHGMFLVTIACKNRLEDDPSIRKIIVFVDICHLFQKHGGLYVRRSVLLYGYRINSVFIDMTIGMQNSCDVFACHHVGFIIWAVACLINNPVFIFGKNDLCIINEVVVTFTFHIRVDNCVICLFLCFQIVYQSAVIDPFSTERHCSGSQFFYHFRF